MPQRDAGHAAVKRALVKNGWRITADPYIIAFDEFSLFVDLGAAKRFAEADPGQFIALQRSDTRIVVEIKEFRGKSVMTDLERAVGQYVLYRIALRRNNLEHEVYLAITTTVYDDLFTKPAGIAVIEDVPMKLIVVDPHTQEIVRWIPPVSTEIF